ncbi:zinc finger protein 568-like [Penaeus japonicus]|uniref:zinc finger protein 568-like n=1 Tax=Penaeus japonicus TaxID=27405 RepID=UPI001C7170C3|nr:zinc finger protein 568-like [Penaeus japonicus]
MYKRFVKNLFTRESIALPATALVSEEPPALTPKEIQHSGGGRSAVWRAKEITSNHFNEREEIRYGNLKDNEARDEVSEATTDLGFPFYRDLKQEDFERDSSNVIEDSNDALPAAPFVAEDFGPKGSSDEDQAAHREGHEELRNYDKRTKSFVCEVCGKKFLCKSYLTKHMRVHTKEKLYSCEVCEKTFSHKRNLVKHIRVHTKERPYICEVCEKAFSQKQHLKQNLVRHMRVHARQTF